MLTPAAKALRLGVFALGFLLLAGCATSANRNVAWYNPGTWFSHTEAAAADKAQVKEQAATAKVDDQRDILIHAASVESFKASGSASSLPPSRPAEITTRLVSNTTGILQQVSPLTAAESADALAVVRGLLSEETAAREKSEAAQATAETAAAKASQALTAAQTALSEAQGKVTTANAGLRAAFDRENTLANELRNERFKFWAAVVAVALLCGLALYLRIGLGSIGAALPRLPSLIGAANAAKVIGALDGETDKLHQWIVSAGAAKTRALESKLASLLGPATPATAP